MGFPKFLRQEQVRKGAAADHPAARGVNHGEAAASQTEKAVNKHGTPAPHSQAHVEADRLSMGHAKRGGC